MTTAADVATLREFARPAIGIRIRYVAAVRISSVSRTSRPRLRSRSTRCSPPPCSPGRCPESLRRARCRSPTNHLNASAVPSRRDRHREHRALAGAHQVGVAPVGDRIERPRRPQHRRHQRSATSRPRLPGSQPPGRSGPGGAGPTLRSEHERTTESTTARKPSGPSR